MKPLVGQVISTKMAKTVVVEVRQAKIYPLYQKRFIQKRKYHVHDEIGVETGDWVKFKEGRPISKTKKWRIVEVIKR